MLTKKNPLKSYGAVDLADIYSEMLVHDEEKFNQDWQENKKAVTP